MFSAEGRRPPPRHRPYRTPSPSLSDSREVFPSQTPLTPHVSLSPAHTLSLSPQHLHPPFLSPPRSFAFLTLHLGTGQSHLRVADGGLACAGLVCPVLELAERLPAGPSARSVFLRTSWRISPNPPYHLARYSAHRMDLINRVE